MGRDSIQRAYQTPVLAAGGRRNVADATQSQSFPTGERPPLSHGLFRTMWLLLNGLLVLSLFFAMYATAWEYSTRRYLTGFSDAIVPATAPAEEKIEAILNWMAHGPARYPSIPNDFMPDRDPTDTLNYYALLQVCGTATNAFINLMDAGHMDVRRLLLLDKRDMTKHVVAEVLVGGRWIVVDPTFRVVLRSTDGRTLTREELSNPATFAQATHGIPRYDPLYTYDHTAHVRIGRLGYLRMPVQRILDQLTPGWERSTMTTIFVERESYAAVISAILTFVFLLLVRMSLLWYGQTRLGIRPVRIRKCISQGYAKLRSAWH